MSPLPTFLSLVIINLCRLRGKKVRTVTFVMEGRQGSKVWFENTRKRWKTVALRPFHGSVSIRGLFTVYDTVSW